MSKSVISTTESVIFIQRYYLTKKYTKQEIENKVRVGKFQLEEVINHGKLKYANNSTHIVDEESWKTQVRDLIFNIGQMNDLKVNPFIGYLFKILGGDGGDSDEDVNNFIKRYSALMRDIGPHLLDKDREIIDNMFLGEPIKKREEEKKEGERETKEVEVEEEEEEEEEVPQEGLADCLKEIEKLNEQINDLKKRNENYVSDNEKLIKEIDILKHQAKKLSDDADAFRESAKLYRKEKEAVALTSVNLKKKIRDLEAKIISLSGDVASKIEVLNTKVEFETKFLPSYKGGFSGQFKLNDNIEKKT